MGRNQVIAVAACFFLLLIIYFFGNTIKPKDEYAPSAGQGHAMPSNAGQQPEALNIDEYIAGVNAKLADSTRQRITKLADALQYKQLIAEYHKIDKPLAEAWYRVKLADNENTAAMYINAGDYCAMLAQSAPDDKARRFLSENIIHCYESAVALDSTSTENRLRLAGAYVEDGTNPMQGIMILRDIVAKDSNNIEAQLMLGKFALMSGQTDKAIARFEKVLYLQPQNSEALFLEAETFEKQGDTNKAVELLEKCEKTLKDESAKKEIENYIQRIKKPNG